MSRSERILLVDNSRVSLMLEETVLRRANNQLTAVTTGEAALSAIQRDQPRLVIFSYDLGGMTGPDLCRIVRAGETTKKTSLLFVGDRQAEQHADLCMSAGCNDVLFRPFHWRELDLKVEKLIRVPVRRDLRTLTKLEVGVDNRGEVLLAHSLNVSSSGILLQIGRTLSPDVRLRVNFFLPADPNPVHVTAQIVRAEFVGSEPRYGLEFVEIDNASRERIGRFVERTQRESH